MDVAIGSHAPHLVVAMVAVVGDANATVEMVTDGCGRARVSACALIVLIDRVVAKVDQIAADKFANQSLTE